MKQVKWYFTTNIWYVSCSVYFAGWQFYLLLRPWNLCLNVLKSSTKILCANTVIPAPLFKLLSKLMFPCWRGVAVFSSTIRVLSLKLYQASGILPAWVFGILCKQLSKKWKRQEKEMVFYNFCLLLMICSK